MSYTYEYPRPALTVDSIVVAPRNYEMYVLLIQRKNEPYKTAWALPGGFVDMNETLEHAAIRELKEETGLEINQLKQFFVFDSIERDPRSRVISVAYYGMIPEPVSVEGMDDALRAEWFPIISLPEMAFDHEHILKKFVKECL